LLISSASALGKYETNTVWLDASDRGRARLADQDRRTGIGFLDALCVLCVCYNGAVWHRGSIFGEGYRQNHIYDVGGFLGRTWRLPEAAYKRLSCVSDYALLETA